MSAPTVSQRPADPDQPLVGDAPPGSHSRGETVLVLALTLLSAAGLVGMTAAIVGYFRPLIVLPLVAAVWAELYLLWNPGLRTPRLQPRAAPTRWWVAAAVLIAVLTIWNARLSAEHSLADRDPGIYLNTAAWLASEGNLVFKPATGAFGSSEQIVTGGPGQYPTGEAGAYHFQFLHLLPVLQAMGSWLGGDFGMSRVPALLAGLALIAFFALATTMLRPWLALLATGALGLNLAFVYTARDSYSEPLMLALLAGGMWLLLRAVDARSWRRVALAGVVLGCAALTRIDFSVYLIGLVAFLALESVRLRDTEWHAFWMRRALPAFVAGLAPGLLLGIADGLLRSRGYVDAQAQALLPLIGLVALATLGAVTVVLAWPRLLWWRRLAGRHRTGLATASALGVVALAVFAFVIRPYFMVERDPGLMGGHQATFSALQQAEGVPVDPDRTYYERSMWWLSWYVGLPVLLAAVAGVALLAARVVHGRARRAEALLLLVALAPLILTLAQPSALPDQPWVMRRFVPLAIPAVIIFAALLAERAFAPPLRVGRPARALRVGGAALAGAMVAFPIAALAPVGGYHAYDDFVEPVRSACQHIGSQGAVAVLPPLSSSLTLAFQSMCKIPAVGIRGQLSARDAQKMADALGRENRRLWLVGDGASLSLSGPLPSLGVQSSTGDRLRPTLTHRPDRVVPHSVSFVMGEVGNAGALTDSFGPEIRSSASPWQWLGSQPWLTVVSEGQTWVGFQAVSYRRPRAVTLRTPSGVILRAMVGTRPRSFIVGPLDVHTRDELEITTTPGPDPGPAGDPRALSVAITDPLVVNQPVAAFGVGGFWPAERDSSGRSFNWIKARARVQIAARREMDRARLMIEASAPRGPLTLVVRAAGKELARLRVSPGFHRYVVDEIQLSRGQATLELVHATTSEHVVESARKLAVMVSKVEATPGSAP